MSKAKLRRQTGPDKIKMIKKLIGSAVRSVNEISYETLTLTSDPDIIKKLESEDDPGLRETYASFLAMDITNCPKGLIEEPYKSHMLINGDEPQKRIKAMGLGTIASLALSAVIPQEKEFNAEMAENLPFTHHNDAVYVSNHFDAPFSDLDAALIYDAIDWTEIFDGCGKSFIPCAQKLARLFDELADEDMKKILDKKRDEILTRILDYAADNYQRSRADKPPEKQPDLILRMRIPSPMEVIQNDPFFGQASTAVKKTADTWQQTFIATILSLRLASILNLRNKLYADFTAEELFYAMTSFCSQASLLKHQTPLAEICLLIVMSQTMTTTANDTMLETPDETNYIRIKTNTVLTTSDEFKKRFDSVNDPKTGDILLDTNLLWYVIESQSGAHCMSEIYVSEHLVDYLSASGLTAEQAYAVAGYIQGWSEANRHYAPVEEYVKDFGEQKQELVKNFTAALAEKENAVRAECQAESEALAQKHAAQIETITSAHKRNERERLNEIRRLNGSVKERDRQIALLEEKLRQAEEERDMWQTSMLEAGETDETDVETAFDPETFTSIGTVTKITVFGGTDNWVSAMQNRFPNIRFYGTNVLPDDNAIANSDMVFIYTRVYVHKYFYRIKGTAGKNNVPVYLLPTAGINSCSDFIARTCLSAENK